MAWGAKLERFVKRVALTGVHRAAPLIASRVHKQPRLVLFGAMNGVWYGDNSRHLYEWYLEHRPDREVYWLTRSPEVERELRAAGRPVVRSDSWAGYLLLLQAGVALITNSLRDVSAANAVPAGLPIVSLRHGRSVKRIRFARQSPISPQEAAEREREGRATRFVISTSEFISDLQEECLRVGREKHIVTGYPRNDILFDTPVALKEQWQAFTGGNEWQQVILYGPTWRHRREPTRFFPFADFDAPALVSLLKQHNILLLLRPHVNDLTRYPALRSFLRELTTGNDVVRIASHYEFPDVNHLLPFIDVLISDYSALYHDFLLLDRPLWFIPYDYPEFEAANGFLYDYWENLPGPALRSFDDFCQHIEAVAAHEDTHQAARRKLRDKIHTYQDGHSSQRVAQLIDQVITS